MANFQGGFGSGFANSFLSTQQQRIQQQQFDESQMSREQTAMADSLTKRVQESEKSSVAAADQFAQIGVDAFSRGAEMAQVAPVIQGAQKALQQHAQLLNEIHAMGVESGAIPPDAPLPGDQFMEMQMSRLSAQLSLAQIQPEEDVSGSTFFGALKEDIPNVGAAGENVRVDQTRTPDGVVFSVNGVEIPGSAIEPTIQKTAEVDLTTRTQSTLEESITNATEGLARLNEIDRTVRSEFLTFPGKLRGFVNEVADKINPALLNDEEKQFLEDYKTFQKTAFDNINRYIKEITGAQMSEFEADRLRRGIPDPERDGPTAFNAKLKQSIRELMLAQARANRALQQGLDAQTGDDLASFMTLTSVETMLEDRHAELVKEGFSDEDALNIVRREFGL